MITKLQYTCLNGQCRYACSTVAQQRLMLQDGPRVTHSEHLAAFVSRLSHWHSHKKHMNLVQVFAMPPLSRLGQRQISSSMVQDFVEYFCAMSDTNLCMSIFLTVKYAYLIRPCSKLAQQRLMRQDGPRVTHSERLAAFLSRLSHWHSHKKQNNFVQVFAMPPLSRLGQRQISSSMVQDFVENFWAMSDTNLCMSTFTTLKYTYLNKHARSKLAQQRLMLQDGPRVTHSERLAAFVSRLCHWHSHKKHMNLVQVFAMPPLFPG